MLSPSLLLQLPSGSLLPFLEPMRTLWPTTETIFARAEQDWIEMMKEMTKTMEQVDEFHRLLLQELTMPNRAHGGTPDNSLRCSGQKEKNGGTFSLSMTIPGFSANELTLKLVGRKLLLLGSKETKKQGDDGSISYKNELIRRESDLPEAVNLEGLACFLSSDGQLCVEGPLQEPPARIERDVPIRLSKELSPEIKRNVTIRLSKEMSPEIKRNVTIQLSKEMSPEIKSNVTIQLSKDMQHEIERNVPIRLSKDLSLEVERNVPIQLSTATAPSAQPEEQSKGDGSKDGCKTDGLEGKATA